jgi:hypothetical protein
MSIGGATILIFGGDGPGGRREGEGERIER